MSMSSGPSAGTQARRQLKFNKQFADLQSKHNRLDQLGAFGGGVSYEMGPDGRLVQTTKAGDYGQQFAGGLSDLGQSYFRGAQNFLADPYSGSSQDADNDAYRYATANLEPRFEQTRAATENRLRNQGLDPTSQAYKSQMNDLALQQNEARNNLVTGIQGQLFNQGLAGRQQQVGEFAQLASPGLNAAGFMAPNVSGYNQVSTGVTPDYGALSAQRTANKNAATSGMLGGIAGLGGKLLTAPMTGGGSLFGSFFG